jgi:hypothetical protein
MSDLDEYSYLPSKKGNLTPPLSHYYGDTVRILFLFGAVVLLVATGVYRDSFDMPIFMSSFGVILLVFLAGLTMYKQRLFTLADVLVSFASTIIFESLVLYGSHGRDTALFWIYQVLAINFLSALYFSVKTFRNSIIKPQE